MGNRSIIIWLLLLWAGICGVQAQEISITASVDRKTIEPGEHIRLTVTLVNGTEALTTPDIGGMVFIQGPFRNDLTGIVNNRMARIINRSWLITAHEPGTYTIGPSRTRVGNSVIQTEPITIEVRKPRPLSPGVAEGQRKDPNLFVAMSLSRSRGIIGEPVTLDYDVYYRYAYVEPSRNDWPLLNGFWTEEVELEREQPRVVTVNGVAYHMVTLRRQLLFPQRSGKLPIAPASFTFYVNPGTFRRGTPVDVETNAVEFTALDLPSKAPPGFTGVVGELQMSVRTDRERVSADEAFELSVKFQGRTNLKLLDPPQLGLPVDFEVYDPKVNDRITSSGSGMQGSREFQYLVIPRHEGSYTLDPITFSYYDTRSGSYKTIESEVITIEVEPRAGGAATGTPRSGVREVAVLDKDIRYIRTGDLELRPHGGTLFGSTLWTVGMATPALAFLVFLGWHRQREASLSDEAGTRRKRADKLARRRLSQAESALKKDQREAFYAALSKALNGYLADKFALGIADVNEATVRNRLVDHTGGPELAEEYVQLINACDMARFAPIEERPRNQLYEQAVQLIGNIERHERS